MRSCPHKHLILSRSAHPALPDARADGTPAGLVAQTGSLPYRRLPTGDTADYQSALQNADGSWRAAFNFPD